jgi:hypothetical protein
MTNITELDNIKIGYKIYRIISDTDAELKDDEGKGRYGYIDYVDKEIKLNKKYTDSDKDQKLNTILHEILHGLNDMYKILPDEKEEEKISVLSNILTEFLIENNLKIIKYVE